MAAHRGLLVPARRHADRRVMADWQAAKRRLGARPGCRTVSRPWLSLSRRWRAKRVRSAFEALATHDCLAGECFRRKAQVHPVAASTIAPSNKTGVAPTLLRPRP